jgi:hypothetical protein
MTNSWEWWLIDDINMKGDVTNQIGANERWHFWWDLNNNGAKDSPDITGDVSDITVIDNKSYGKLPELVATYNDDYVGQASLFIYDDDISSSWQFTSPLYLPGYRVINAQFEAYQWANVWERIDWSSLYAGGPMTYCKNMSVYQNLAPWNETGVNWTNYAPSTSNMNYEPEDTFTMEDRRPFLGTSYPEDRYNGRAHWETFDITDLAYDWLEGKATNYGISVMPTMENNNLVNMEHTSYYSSGTPQYVTQTYKPKLTVEVDMNNDGLPDANYLFQPADGNDACIAQCAIDTKITREAGADVYLLTNLYSTSLGYSSIGSFYRRGLIEFDLSSVVWRSENSVIWEDPGFNMTIDVEVFNKNPELIDNTPKYHIPGDLVEFDVLISDDGSDDLNYTYDFGDGSIPIIGGLL